MPDTYPNDNMINAIINKNAGNHGNEIADMMIKSNHKTLIIHRFIRSLVVTIMRIDAIIINISE